MTKNKAWLQHDLRVVMLYGQLESRCCGSELGFYEVPWGREQMWYDGWVIPKYARNVKAASYFINYLCRPEVALRNMDACGYVSSVATPKYWKRSWILLWTIMPIWAISLVPRQIVSGLTKCNIRPSVVERCAMIRDSGERTEAVLEMWSRVKGIILIGNCGCDICIGRRMLVYTVYRRIQRYQQWEIATPPQETQKRR